MKTAPFFTAVTCAATTLASPAPWGRGGWGRWHGGGRPSHHSGNDYSTWDLENFESLVVFGDSYSDDSRLGYFIENDGEAPPVGWLSPVVSSSFPKAKDYDGVYEESKANEYAQQNPKAADGGRIWGQYVLQYSSAANLYNYAVSGAVCSNDITPRYFSAIDAPFPAVSQYEIPAYLADSAYVTPEGDKFIKGSAEDTVYAMWIGTNDLGYAAFIEDAQVEGTNLTSYVDCVYESLGRVYDNGGRYFVLFNNAPLYFAPEYAGPPNDVGANQYWADKPENHTLIEQRMLEEVVTTNEIFDYRTPVEVALQGRWPGARFAVFDVNSLVRHPILPAFWTLSIAELIWL